MKFSIKKSKKIVLKLLLLSVVVYVVFLFINQQIKIKEKETKLESLNKQISAQKSKNEEIRGKLDESSDGEAEKKGNLNKRVFENVAQ